MLNIENQHLHDSNKELSHRDLCLKTTVESLESRILHVDYWMEHCLSSHIHGDDSAENPFTLEGGDLRISIMYDLTNPYHIEPVHVGEEWFVGSMQHMVVRELIGYQPRGLFLSGRCDLTILLAL